MLPARANLWSIDACVVANEQTASITPASSLELTCTCSGECSVYEGPGVSSGAGAEGGGGGDGGDKLALGSSPPLALPQEQDHLPSGDPLLPHLVPPPGPTAGGEKRSA